MRPVLLFGLLLLPIALVNAQYVSVVDSTVVDSTGVDSLPEKRSVWRFSGGTGLLLPLGFPPTIYRQIGINVQVGITYEYFWRRRLSLLTGADYRLQTLVADAQFIPTPRTGEMGRRIIAQPAPDSLKYASLRYHLITIPVMVRYYFARNVTRRLFIDVGASFNVPVAVSYRYRLNGMMHQDKLTPFVQQPIIFLELAGGATGRVFGGRLTKVNNLLGSLLFGGFLSLNSSVRTTRNKTVTTVGFLTKFVF